MGLASVIEFRDGANRRKAGRRMAILAGDIQASVGILNTALPYGEGSESHRQYHRHKQSNEHLTHVPRPSPIHNCLTASRLSRPNASGRTEPLGRGLIALPLNAEKQYSTYFCKCTFGTTILVLGFLSFSGNRAN